ncbi:helix-turn-helix transcriptional regulator [Aestuariirhabdus litorea]|uniref:Helix-turn-helix domain-containing protein n=1 Tax=Aestuariirhabdus litorea TaxID=2528527 RepID=A0A3P3VL56_9GAMM|nr:helix-turn-helix transcriptional regulator [Aestuariirhabdus litorea]RRJ82608.1 helix-turn-helix domain-containing protein [Aestuariirhabdus litorea]RWW92767.1 helix-turn-helix domain-containing protein [Endozoicomonadaceae bacterium GTF-13]
MHGSLLEQIKKRRKSRGLRQEDLALSIGMSRQQFQRTEAGGNPRLDTLELIAAGLQCELLLVPRPLVDAVGQLERGELIYETVEDPWGEFLADCEDDDDG